MEGLKEWATVVKALEQGKQTVILRKGGIIQTFQMQWRLQERTVI